MEDAALMALAHFGRILAGEGGRRGDPGSAADLLTTTSTVAKFLTVPVGQLGWRVFIMLVTPIISIVIDLAAASKSLHPSVQFAGFSTWNSNVQKALLPL